MTMKNQSSFHKRVKNIEIACERHNVSSEVLRRFWEINKLKGREAE
ncbi:hypothetical protein SAMN05518684_10828 [Salipaludibacillus aurantiacus]|uniref:Uncharacterized protein n=1 Tax=Salipaludibacillus aurantiacus TaxID=1601833 RepID=A0A1H9UMP5_9BACI|nr:hypothetical protein SAMN05518684_10828 [Salipaludibacillus aurantiacus]